MSHLINPFDLNWRNYLKNCARRWNRARGAEKRERKVRVAMEDRLRRRKGTHRGRSRRRWATVAAETQGAAPHFILCLSFVPCFTFSVVLCFFFCSLLRVVLLLPLSVSSPSLYVLLFAHSFVKRDGKVEDDRCCFLLVAILMNKSVLISLWHSQIIFSPLLHPSPNFSHIFSLHTLCLPLKKKFWPPLLLLTFFSVLHHFFHALFLPLPHGLVWPIYRPSSLTAAF